MTALAARVLHFNGKDNFVKLPPMTVDYSKGFTVEAWVRFHSYKDWSRIVDFGNGPALDNIVLANAGTIAQINLTTYKGHGRLSLHSNVLQEGVWMHIAGIIQGRGGYGKLLKNGVTTDGGPLHVPAAIQRARNYIGKSNWSTDGYFHGCIADLRVWNVAHTDVEIANNRYRRLTGAEPGLVGYWPLDDGQGATVKDRSPSAYHGTIHGATWTTLEVPYEIKEWPEDRESELGGDPDIGEKLKREKWFGEEAKDRPLVDGSGELYFIDTQKAFPRDGRIKAWRIFAKASSQVQLIIARKTPAGGFTFVHSTPYAVPKVGVNEFALPAPLEVKAGDLLGWSQANAGAIAAENLDHGSPHGNAFARVLFAGSSRQFVNSVNRAYSIEVLFEASSPTIEEATAEWEKEREALEKKIADLEEDLKKCAGCEIKLAARDTTLTDLKERISQLEADVAARDTTLTELKRQTSQLEEREGVSGGADGVTGGVDGISGELDDSLEVPGR